MKGCIDFIESLLFVDPRRRPNATHFSTRINTDLGFEKSDISTAWTRFKTTTTLKDN